MSPARGAASAVVLGALLVIACDERPAPPPGPLVVASDSAPAERDREILAAFQAAGGELTRPQPVRHLLLFGTVEAARSAMAALEQLGYTVTIRRSASAPRAREFLVMAEGRVVPAYGYFAERRERFTALAAGLGGHYDGWELTGGGDPDAGP